MSTTSLVKDALTRSSSTKTKRLKLRQAMTKELIGEKTGPMGRSLIALADFGPGEVIAPIDGEHTWGGDELTRLPPEDYAFVCDMLHGRYRMTTPDKASVGWHLANHSCTPNSRLSVVLLSTRRIARGDEITVHYGWRDVRAEDMKCLCGAPACYGTVGPRVHRVKKGDEEVTAWRAYLDALIANRNVQGLIELYGAIDANSWKMLVQHPGREHEIEEITSKSPPFYDYGLPVERILSVSF